LVWQDGIFFITLGLYVTGSEKRNKGAHKLNWKLKLLKPPHD